MGLTISLPRRYYSVQFRQKTHLARLDSMLYRLRMANLKIQVSDAIHADPAEVQAIRDAQAPTCIREVRSFLGLTGYYRKFAEDIAENRHSSF